MDPKLLSMAVFWQAVSVRFVTQYAEYEQGMELKQQCAVDLTSSAVGFSTAVQVYPFMPIDGTELQDDDLRDALAKHAECWTGDYIDPSIAGAEVCRRVTMGSEATAVGRTDTVQSRLEHYFENQSAETFSVMRVRHSNEGPQPSIIRRLWPACTRPSLRSRARVRST